MILDATTVDFTASRSSDLLHFSGHSFTDPVEPRKSRLAFQDRHYYLDEIIDSGSGTASFLTVLSSCQSALASTFSLGDEYLGIQAAFLYGGGHFAIGALWPVQETPTVVFMNRLYFELSQWIRLDICALYSCIRDAQT